MSPIRQDALMMVQSLPENQLHFIVNVMKELSRLMPVKEKTEYQCPDFRRGVWWQSKKIVKMMEEYMQRTGIDSTY